MADMDTHRTPGSAVLWTAAVGITTVVAYLAFLGWDQHKDFDPVTQLESGPYQPWQIIGLGLVLAVLAFAAGWRHRLLPVVVAIPVALTACFIVDAVTDAESDGLWPIGAALVAFGSLFGTSLVAALGIGLRSARHKPVGGAPSRAG